MFIYIYIYIFYLYILIYLYLSFHQPFFISPGSKSSPESVANPYQWFHPGGVRWPPIWISKFGGWHELALGEVYQEDRQVDVQACREAEGSHRQRGKWRLDPKLWPWYQDNPRKVARSVICHMVAARDEIRIFDSDENLRDRQANLRDEGQIANLSERA